MKHFLVIKVSNRQLNAQKYFIFTLERICNSIRIRISQKHDGGICEIKYLMVTYQFTPK